MSYHNTTQSATNTQGQTAPEGYHYMPDGSLMSDASHDYLYGDRALKKINTFIIDDSDLEERAVSRTLTINGNGGARFTLFISNEDVAPIKYYDIVTGAFITGEARINGKIPESGTFTTEINFPAVTDDDQYDFQLVANTHHNAELALSGVSNKIYYKKSILQKIDRIVKAQITTDTTGDFQSFASVVTVAEKPPLSTNVTTYAFSETVKAVDADTGGALKITRQPIPTDFYFATTHESIGLGTAATASTNPTILYLNSVDNLAVGMALVTIESSSIAGSPVITKIDRFQKMVTLSVAQTWVTEKDITFHGYCSTPQVNNATSANITITDMSVELTPLTATVNGATSASNTIVLDSAHGIRADGTVTVYGINFDNRVAQYVTNTSYGTNTIQVTGVQTLQDDTILTFKGCSQEAVFKAKIKVTKMQDALENTPNPLILYLDIDNILTSSIS